MVRDMNRRGGGRGERLQRLRGRVGRSVFVLKTIDGSVLPKGGGMERASGERPKEMQERKCSVEGAEEEVEEGEGIGWGEDASRRKEMGIKKVLSTDQFSPFSYFEEANLQTGMRLEEKWLDVSGC